MPETPEKDPVISKSLSGYLFIASVLLLLSLAWALWQEFFGIRPWKDYEHEFVSRYSAYLHKQIPLQEQAEKDIENSPAYQTLQREYQDLEKSILPKKESIESQTALMDARMAGVLDRLTDVRSQVAAREYTIEHTTTDLNRKGTLEKTDLDPLKATKYTLSLQSLEGPGKFDKVTLDFKGLEDELARLQTMKSQLQAQEGDLLGLSFDQLFDGVCLWDTIEHLPNPREVVRRSAELLKPGGHLFLATGDFGAVLPRLQGLNWRQIHPPTHLFYFTRQSFRELCPRAGLEVVRFSTVTVHRRLGSVFQSLENLYGQSLTGRVASLALRVTPRGILNWNFPLNLGDTLCLVARKK